MGTVKEQVERERAEALQEERTADKITKALKGRMKTTREGIIRTLNQRRRREGVYARKKSNKMPRGSL